MRGFVKVVKAKSAKMQGARIRACVREGAFYNYINPDWLLDSEPILLDG